MSAEGLRARLARLRREGEHETSAEAGGAPPSGGSSALELLRARDARLAAASPASPTGAPLPPPTLGPPAALVPLALAEGRAAARVETFPTSHRHGSWRLDASLAVEREALAFAAREPALAHVSLEQAVFLDTETTGLAGGAGTWVFLIGLGRFAPRGFELWQGFLAEPAGERALLAEAAERLRAAPLVVSFFGKSFDRHRLEDKLRLHGLAAPFGELLHLDLYHPLRRLYGAAHEDGRLATLERALTGVERVHDLSGAHAPEAWYDFLAGRPHRLERVFAHNRDDVLSLVTLAAHLACAPSERRPDGTRLDEEGRAEGQAAAARAAALARACAESGRLEEALDWLRRALERGAPEERLARARAELAKRLERRGAREEALAQCSLALAAPLSAGLRRELERRRARLAQRDASSARRALPDVRMAGGRRKRSDGG